MPLSLIVCCNNQRFVVLYCWRKARVWSKSGFAGRFWRKIPTENGWRCIVLLHPGIQFSGETECRTGFLHLFIDVCEGNSFVLLETRRSGGAVFFFYTIILQRWSYGFPVKADFFLQFPLRGQKLHSCVSCELSSPELRRSCKTMKIAGVCLGFSRTQEKFRHTFPIPAKKYNRSLFHPDVPISKVRWKLRDQTTHTSRNLWIRSSTSTGNWVVKSFTWNPSPKQNHRVLA